MDFSKATFLVAVLTAGILTGCDTWGGSEINEDIEFFVESENLPDVQPPEVSFDDPDSDVKAFRVAFGPGCDCPSGCIYSRGYGLKFGDRIGWMKVTEVFFCAEDSLDIDPSYFEVQPSDSTLFDQDFRDRFREATEEEDPDGYAPIYEVFLQMLGGDEDTSTGTLHSLTELLFDEYLPNLADALIKNPVVRSEVAILERLANLPDQAGYRPVKEKAQELLDQRSQRISAPVSSAARAAGYFPRSAASYCPGIMTCAQGVPGSISQGPPCGFVGRPVLSAVS